MRTLQTIAHKNMDIIHVNISDASALEIVKYLRLAQEEMENLPPNSALVLMNATNAVYNSLTSNVIKEFATTITRYSKALAVIGIDGMSETIVKSISNVSNGAFKAFADQTEALDWLVMQ
ncbi:MAG: hypothetical protein JEZ00_02050 [Anaerolineaceae bacterium]|nr:hypothetical protein [Anaerolineaceae bacterium]